MDSRTASEVSISDLFDQFMEATTMKTVLSTHHRILNYSDLEPSEFNSFFPKLKRAVLTCRSRKNWKAKALFSKIDKKAAHRCYSNAKAPTPLGARDNEAGDASSVYCNNNSLQGYNGLIIGAGPAGLRTAIELQLLGASKVVIIEKRGRFSRNNVLHLWPFVIEDLKSLGAKKFYGKFCAGSIDHIAIRQLQLMLLKVCLIIGCDFRDSCSYLHICPSSVKSTNDDNSDRNKSPTNNVNNELSQNKCDIYSAVTSSQSNHSIILTESEGQSITSARSASETNNNADNNDSCLSATSSGRPCQSFVRETNSEQIDQEQPRREENLNGVRAHFQSEHSAQDRELHGIEWDVVIGADGRRNTLNRFFPRKEFRGRLAIAITANFINRQTPAETAVSEISGLSYIYNQDMFNALAYDTGIELENICYYKDDTHYFVMTAKKRSLLERKVLLKDYAATHDLLSDSNIDKQALLKYAKDAAHWTTGLDPLDFAINHYGKEDCAMFDFTSMYAASNACKALKTSGGGLTLFGLVGDSLLEPFWPTGSGCGRGFLSAFDAAWMCRQWAFHKCAVRGSANLQLKTRSSASDSHHVDYNRMALSVIAERESIYRILGQTTSENIQQNYPHWTLNPHTRYPNLNRHLITCSQVDHLLTDSLTRTPLPKLKPAAEKPARVKSPRNNLSPRKLKSANSSPQARPKNARNNRLAKDSYKSRSRQEISREQNYLEFERSYKYLEDSNRGARQHLSRHSHGRDPLSPSISGTHPSSNNLYSLEAKRNRDLDECMRQRRQKAQLSVVKDKLKAQFGPQSDNNQKEKPGTPFLFTELKKLRENQIKNKLHGNQELVGPLTVLNSMKRCASFAERLKSFEENRKSFDRDSQVSTPKTPIDNVKNLPQFATLQEFFVNNSNANDVSEKKAKMPIMKLSKDDWNVKCWEERLARDAMPASKSAEINLRPFKFEKPAKQIDIFKGRIKQMADKLGDSDELPTNAEKSKTMSKDYAASEKSKTWVSQLKKELASGASSKGFANKDSIANTIGRKPVKKLFEDEEDDDGEHCDHLCTNRVASKYALHNGYSSHLRRTKFDDSRVINRTQIQLDKPTYLSNLTSRGSSASSTISDKSSNTGGSSSGADRRVEKSFRCARCKLAINDGNKITIDQSNLHMSCITCAECDITLRTNEIQHYLRLIKAGKEQSEFVCSICRPNMRKILLNNSLNDSDHKADEQSATVKSREEFLSQKINYNELYRNILSNEIPSSIEADKTKDEQSSPKEEADDDSESYRIVESENIDGSEQVTLVLPPDDKLAARDSFTIYRERPDPEVETQALVDEDELNRILGLNKQSEADENLTASRRSSSDSGDANQDEDTSDISDDGERGRQNGNYSDDPSSLNSPPNSEDLDDTDDNMDRDSTHRDVLTSEEFGDPSDVEDEQVPIEEHPPQEKPIRVAE